MLASIMLIFGWIGRFISMFVGEGCVEEEGLDGILFTRQDLSASTCRPVGQGLAGGQTGE